MSAKLLHPQAQSQSSSDGRVEALMAQNAELMKQIADSRLNILADSVLNLKQEISELKNSQRAENAFSILNNTITGSFAELKGIRTDLKPLAEGMIARMQPPPPPRSPADRERIKAALPGAIQEEKESLALEGELFGLGGPPRPGVKPPTIISEGGLQ
jgi:hypothetical protein